MTPDDRAIDEIASDAPREGLLRRHPKLQILLIAGVFYLLLISMCAFVAVAIFRS